MQCALTAVVALINGLVAVSPISAQSSARPWNDCLATEIQDRLVSQHPVRLSADSITLAGNTLRLSGKASVRYDRTTIRAEEIIIDQSSKRVEFTRVRQIDLGSGSRCAPPPSAPPKIEFR